MIFRPDFLLTSNKDKLSCKLISPARILQWLMSGTVKKKSVNDGSWLKNIVLSKKTGQLRYLAGNHRSRSTPITIFQTLIAIKTSRPATK